MLSTHLYFEIISQNAYCKSIAIRILCMKINPENTMLLFLLACGDVDKHDHDHHHHEHEVMTTVVATFTNDSEEIIVTWDDVEQDGSPSIDDLLLSNGSEYTLALQFVNRLEDPEEDITPEIKDEADEHQIFFLGDAFSGLVSYEYLDADENNLPLGLETKISTLQAGSGEFTIALRHMPPDGDSAVKVEGLAEEVESNGLSNIGGANDVMVTFPLTVE